MRRHYSMLSSEVTRSIIYFKVSQWLKCDEDEWVAVIKSGNRTQDRRLNHQLRDQCILDSVQEEWRVINN